MERKKRRQRIIANLIVGLVTLIHIFPLVIVVINSLRSDDEVARSMLALPTELLFSNYINAWIKGNYINAYASTLLISLATAIIVMVTTGLAAYGLVKANAYGKKFFDGYFIIGLSIPYFAMMVPVFYIFYKFNLVNSRIGMIILYTATNIPFSYMFIKAFLEGLPHELDEAARIDGCTEMQNFYCNVLPLAKPILTSMVLITFVNCWNEFLFSNLFLQDANIRTVALQFYNFTGRYNIEYGLMYAAAIITIAPIVIIYLLTQNTFIEGMTAGSVKG